MESATLKKKTNWLFPSENEEQPTLTEYRNHIKQAEHSGFMSFEEFEKRHSQWESPNL